MALSFDPHPYGCPMGLAVTPERMPELLTRVCIQLRDLVHASILVITPRKGRGDSYPVLYLWAVEGDDKPRMVFFPAWEDNGGRRRLDYKRQFTLMERIADAGVAGEDLEDYRGVVDDERAKDAVVVRLAVSSAQMASVVNELLEYLADLTRVVVLEVPRPSGIDLLVVRVYGVGPETKPRLVLMPNWEGEGESPTRRITERDEAEILGQLADLREVPAEAYLL